jgi:PadR family transcriptional regulator
MGKEPRLSAQTIKVLSTLMSHPADELSGAEIAKRSHLASGTLYPILSRLEDAGWLESRWEEGRAADLGRPRRRYYKITAAGAKRVEKLVRDLTPSVGRLAWS